MTDNNTIKQRYNDSVHRCSAFTTWLYSS